MSWEIGASGKGALHKIGTSAEKHLEQKDMLPSPPRNQVHSLLQFPWDEAWPLSESVLDVCGSSSRAGALVYMCRDLVCTATPYQQCWYSSDDLRTGRHVLLLKHTESCKGFGGYQSPSSLRTGECCCVDTLH